MKFRNKIAVGNSGSGLATARLFREHGAKVAIAVLFLASSEASYITGVEVEVRGGIGQV